VCELDCLAMRVSSFSGVNEAGVSGGDVTPAAAVQRIDTSIPMPSPTGDQVGNGGMSTVLCIGNYTWRVVRFY
jgi:hypothetical protein